MKNIRPIISTLLAIVVIRLNLLRITRCIIIEKLDYSKVMKILKIIKTAKVCAETAPKLRKSTP